MKQTAIIVAGGKGLRMGGDIPKQYIPLNGKPILMYTLEAFHRFNPSISLILVIPPSDHNYWRQLCATHCFSIVHRLASGGETRFHSVRNGLALVDDSELVAVHDGVRPFVTPALLQRCFDAAARCGAAIPVTEVFETIRQLLPNGKSITVDRSSYRLVQTPQVFSLRVISEAYRQPYRPEFTDDASVVEAIGFDVSLVEGIRENIKITTPHDLHLASQLLTE